MRHSEQIPREETVVIFSNIELILSIHCDLLKKLKQRLGISYLPESTQRQNRKGGAVFSSDIEINSPDRLRSAAFHVGDIFAEMVKSFLAYDQYCSNYKKSMDAVKRIKKNPFFQNLIRKRDPSESELRDHLIKPIQKLCR
eukprot:TRINITY_DN6656_c0_g1_i1.p1 TRINITY_DN6656_c0_g1~~TRINITY_DN6656_c0_g1_i1.p1  ORF type:complete len:141 (-),score=15.53 TRINITY_DN6656_c0_g1_i1:13-435(-)